MNENLNNENSNNENSSFDCVLKEIPLEDGYTTGDMMIMMTKLNKQKFVTISIEAQQSIAEGFISLDFAEKLNYDFNELSKYMASILNDMIEPLITKVTRFLFQRDCSHMLMYI